MIQGKTGADLLRLCAVALALLGAPLQLLDSSRRDSDYGVGSLCVVDTAHTCRASARVTFPQRHDARTRGRPTAPDPSRRARNPSQLFSSLNLQVLIIANRQDDFSVTEPVYLPTICSASWLFSLQMYSQISSPGARSATCLTVQGFVKVSGSSYVVSNSRCPKSGRRIRVIMRSFSVWGKFPGAIQALSLKPIVSTTSVSPSHLPVECPSHVGSRSGG